MVQAFFVTFFTLWKGQGILLWRTILSLYKLKGHAQSYNGSTTTEIANCTLPETPFTSGWHTAIKNSEHEQQLVFLLHCFLSPLQNKVHSIKTAPRVAKVTILFKNKGLQEQDHANQQYYLLT